MILRSIASFFAILAALGVGARLVGAGFDPTGMWIHLSYLPPLYQTFVLAGVTVALFAIGLGERSYTLSMAAATLAFLCAVDAARFYILLSYGRFESSFPVSLSAVFSIAFLLITITLARRPHAPAGAASAADSAQADDEQTVDERRRLKPPLLMGTVRLVAHVVLIGVWACSFALLQMFCYGKTDYTRPADAIVVLGARVYDDGTLSDALADRVRTGIRLYHEGRAPLLIMSGAAGEPEAMRDFAVLYGVPRDAIELDPTGVNTRGTVDYLGREHRRERVLAVSHFYHLPRIKLAADQSNLRVYTVPADESYTLRAMPRYIAREVVAFWWYLFN
jgi:uncharacterized SAM-binding protein YcdF (DUF218 family)